MRESTFYPVCYSTDIFSLEDSDRFFKFIEERQRHRAEGKIFFLPLLEGFEAPNFDGIHKSPLLPGSGLSINPVASWSGKA